MHPLLSNKEFLVKQRVGMPGDPYSYDVLDPATGKVVMTCTEPALAMPIKALRFLSRLVPTSIVPLKLQRILPFYLEIRTPANFMVMSLRQGWSIFRSRTEVLDGRGEAIGAFVQSFVKRLNTLREKEDDPSTIPLLCDLRDDLDNPAATLQHESFHEFRLIQDEADWFVG